MTQKPKVRPSGQNTRNRILEAAMLRFAQHSYEETKLRDIADDVGVDVALVHLSFGSKEQLFAEVVNVAFQPQHVFATDGKDLVPNLTNRVLEPSLDRTLRLIDPLDILIRSMLSPEAIPIIRQTVTNDFIKPLADRLGGPAATRAALVAACLAGISIFRNVLFVEALLPESDRDLKHLITHVLKTAMGNPPAGRANAKT